MLWHSRKPQYLHHRCHLHRWLLPLLRLTSLVLRRCLPLLLPHHRRPSWSIRRSQQRHRRQWCIRFTRRHNPRHTVSAQFQFRKCILFDGSEFLKYYHVARGMWDTTFFPSASIQNFNFCSLLSFHLFVSMRAIWTNSNTILWIYFRRLFLHGICSAAATTARSDAVTVR